MTREGGMEVVEANGARIPLIGLGTWDLRGRVCAQIVEQALRLGYRHIDTAEMYDNEREVGEIEAQSKHGAVGYNVTLRVDQPGARLAWLALGVCLADLWAQRAAGTLGRALTAAEKAAVAAEQEPDEKTIA